jgi:TetR/AcrR family transcriptional regulator, cholesterol catabolism regulator
LSIYDKKCALFPKLLPVSFIIFTFADKLTFVSMMEVKSKGQQVSRREEILDKAARLFKQKGYVATTMREIAEQVGMEAASMYNHIRGKEELLEEICARVAETYVNQMNEIESSDLSPIHKLQALIRSHISITTKNIHWISVANNEWRHLPETSLKSFKKARDTYEDRLAEIIRSGIDCQEVADVHVSITLYTILSSLRWIETWYKPNKSYNARDLEENIVNILMNGLKKSG